jgi:spoIIIJ-associated protein
MEERFMNSKVEFEGKDINEAINTAVKSLNVEKSNLKYEVISSGSRGLFGIGARNAVIIVSNEKIEKINTQKNKNDSLTNSIVDEVFNDAKYNEPESNKTSDQNNDKNNTDFDYEMLIKEGKEALEKIVHSISSENALIDASVQNKEIHFNITNADTAILIGKRGNTLDAIQFILEKMINKKIENKKRVYVQVDVEGYLVAKKSKLINFALKIARNVQKNGKPLSMGEKNFSDRRIIHRFLKNNKNVKVISKGEGIFKKLIIFPAKEKK